MLTPCCPRMIHQAKVREGPKPAAKVPAAKETTSKPKEAAREKKEESRREPKEGKGAPHDPMWG